MNITNKSLIVAYEKGYRVVDGEVISPISQKPLSCYIRFGKRDKGYKRFGIKDYKGIRRTISVHRLIAYQKFGDKIFEDGIQVRHLDGNSLNNLDDNIDIGNRSQNMMDVKKDVRIKSAYKASSHIRKFTDEQEKQIREDHKKTKSYKKVMEKWEITSKGTLNYILKKTGV